MEENKEQKNSKENKSQQIYLCKSIKSFLNVKNIFSHLTALKKLKLLIYNRYIQNRLGIDIELYKLYSGKYKIGKKDGLGKEFKLYTDILLYEGRYKNGKRNGKGKEYNER